MVRYKGKSPKNEKKRLVYTGHRGTIVKVKASNDILTGLTDQGKTWVTLFYCS